MFSFNIHQVLQSHRITPAQPFTYIPKTMYDNVKNIAQEKRWIAADVHAMYQRKSACLFFVVRLFFRWCCCCGCCVLFAFTCLQRKLRVHKTYIYCHCALITLCLIQRGLIYVIVRSSSFCIFFLFLLCFVEDLYSR